MKFICLGYADTSKFAKMSAPELKRAMDECFDYDDLLRAGGHFTGGEALQDPANAITLRYVDGRVQITDGPYAETKEQLGDVPDLRFVDQPKGVRNHPAWTLSHLSSSLGFLLKLLDEAEGASTDSEDKQYGNGSIPTNIRLDYLPKVDLLRTLRQRHEYVESAVRSKHEQYFARETPEPLKGFAPTIGRIAVYLLVSHESYHLGQLMQWRRAAELTQSGSP